MIEFFLIWEGKQQFYQQRLEHFNVWSLNYGKKTHSWSADPRCWKTSFGYCGTRFLGVGANGFRTRIYNRKVYLMKPKLSTQNKRASCRRPQLMSVPIVEESAAGSPYLRICLGKRWYTIFPKMRKFAPAAVLWFASEKRFVKSLR